MSRKLIKFIFLIIGLYISVVYANEENISFEEDSNTKRESKYNKNTSSSYSNDISILDFDDTLKEDITAKQKSKLLILGYELTYFVAAELPPILAYLSSQSEWWALASFGCNLVCAPLTIVKILNENNFNSNKLNLRCILEIIGACSIFYSSLFSGNYLLNIRENRDINYSRLANLGLTTTSATTYIGSKLISCFSSKQKEKASSVQ